MYRDRDQEGSLSAMPGYDIKGWRENKEVKRIPLHDSLEALRDVKSFEVKLLDL